MNLKVRSEFTKNILTLVTGTSISQAIPIAITPILTRIYSPSDFGVFALFLAITSILGSIAGGRYELAIVLPEKDEDAVNIAFLALLITTSLSIVLLVIVTVFNSDITIFLGNESISKWLYLTPVSIFFIGCFNILSYLNTRSRLFKNIAIANVNKSVVMSITQVSVGILKKGASGLILGQFLAYIMSNYKLFKSANSQYDFIKTFDKSKLKTLALRYQDFPKYSTGAILANTLSYQLLNILISKFYSVATLGYYSLVQKVIGMPSALIGGAVSQVFFTQASQEKIKKGNCSQIFNKVLLRLTLISFLLFIPMYFVIEYMFILVFGENWSIAGKYAEILIPFFAVRFIVVPLTITNSIFEKQIVSLIWQIFLMIFSIITLFLSDKLSLSFEDFLSVWVVVMTVHYLLLLLLLSKIAKG